MNICIFGDSNAVGYRYTEDANSFKQILLTEYKKLASIVHVLAECGTTISPGEKSFLAYLEKDGRCDENKSVGNVPTASDVCIVMLGTNDIVNAQTYPAPSLRGPFREILEQVSSFGTPGRIYVVAPISGQTSARKVLRTEEVRAIVEAETQAFGAKYVNIAPLPSEFQVFGKKGTVDVAHVTADYYRKIATYLQQDLQADLKEDLQKDMQGQMTSSVGKGSEKRQKTC
jgi:lysophospholipase L1-like esterase